MLAQTPPHAWAIVDKDMKAFLEIADPYYREGDQIDREKVEELLANSPYIKCADTLDELAQKIDVDPATFNAEIERYNKACEQGEEHENEERMED